MISNNTEQIDQIDEFNNMSAEIKQNQLDQTSSSDKNTHLVRLPRVRSQEISFVLTALAKEVVAALTAKACCIYILDQRQQELIPYAFWGVPDVVAHFSRQAVDEGIVGLAVQLGDNPSNQGMVRVDDFKSDTRFKSTKSDFPYHSALALPLPGAAEGRLVGVILVVDKIDPPIFSPQDEEILRSFVDQSDLLLTLEKIYLDKERRGWDKDLVAINQISQHLSTSLHMMDVDAICRTVLYVPPCLRDILQFDIAEICLWDTQTKTLTTAVRLPDDVADIQTYERIYHAGEGYTGWIATNQKPLLINDTHHYPEVMPKADLYNFPYRSYIGVPLKVGLKFLGTLELAAIEPGAYIEEDITILEIVTKQVAIAIDHARLFQKTQRNLSDLSLLFDTGRELSSTLSYEDVLRDLSRRMTHVFSADECIISSFDEATGVLNLIQQYIKPASGESEESETEDLSNLKQVPLAVAKFSALLASFEEQIPLTVRLNDPDIGLQELELLKQRSYEAMVAIPLISRGKVTGLVQLFSKHLQAFTEDEIWLAQSLANQANIALENARLFSLTDQELQKRVDELAGLQRVSGELNSTLDLNRILTLILEEAIRVTQADFGNVNLYDAKTGDLVAHKEQGRSNAVQSRAPYARIASAQQGIMGRALRTGKAILVPNVLEDKDVVPLGDEGIGSRVVVPIYYGGEPAGVINLESRQLDFFNDGQLRYLEALANQAAVAIGNAQAYQEQKRERERASRRAGQLARLSEISNAFRTNRPLHEILEDIAYAIVESVGYNVVLISLVQSNPPVINHEVAAGIPVAQFGALQNSTHPLSNLQAIMREEFRLSNSYFIPAERMEVWQDKLDVPYIEKYRLPTYILSEVEGFLWRETEEKEHTWQTGDVLFVPLTDTEERIIGLLTVENPDTDQRPDVSSAQTLEIFANHAAAAIENARLFGLEQQRRRLADTLRGVAEAISAQLDFDELLNVVLQELANVVDYDSANVQLLQEDQLIIVGGHGWEDSQQVIGLSFSMEGDNPNRLVIETQEPVIIRDAQQEYPASFSQPPHGRIKSWLGVPLTYGTNVLGLMAVDSAQANFFTREDADVVLAFANQVAVALQNARLFEEARQQVRQLAALTQVAQSLNRALDLNEVLNLVLDAVFDLVGQSKGSIWLIDHSSNTVKIADTKNVPNFLVELFNESAISIDSEPFASVIKSGQMLVIEGSATKKDDIANYGLPFPDDVTYVPLKTEDGVIGILAIEVVIHNKNMLKLVTTLADLAAVAIDSARLLEDTRRRANEMQHLYNLGVQVSGMLEVRQVMGSVVSNALTLTDTQIGAILFWDEESKRYIIDGAVNTTDPVAELILSEAQETGEAEPAGENISSLWHDLTQQIVDTGQSLFITPPAPVNEQLAANHPSETLDPPHLLRHVKRALPLGVRAVLGVPIQVQNQTSGAIFVCNLTPRNFNERDVQLLSFVANQAAVAMRNAQLVQRLNLLTEELEQRVAQRTEELAKTLQDLMAERDRVGALYQITRELSASFDLDRVLVEALSLINRAVGISHGSILLLDRESGNLMYRAALGRSKPLSRGGLKTKYKLGYGLAGTVMEMRQPRIVADLSVDPDWIANKEIPDRRSALVVPLITGEEVMGALLLFHPEVGYFTEDHLKLVTAAGVQVATAINNAELYRLITDQAQRLGVMLRTQAAETAKNQAILKGITDGVLVLDTKRNIVLINPKAAEILNVNPAALENQSIHQSLGRTNFSTESGLAQLFYENLLKSLTEVEAGKRSAEFRIEAGNNAVAVTLAPVALGAEELPSIIAVLRDISKEAEIERIKNEFISTVSHELRTPMTSIKGYTDLLVSGSSQVGELNPTQRRFVQVIQSNANRLTELVNDILEISRIETGRVKLQLESLDLMQIIRDVAVSFEGQMVKKAMNLSLDLPDYLPNIYADKARATQVLVNLIGNAWQYTPEGRNIIVHASIEGNFARVDVEDTGIGIVEKDLEYIFERFFRSERTEVQVVDGTGLGLSITKTFVEMLGGKIWVKSELDVGSTFSFTLPLEAKTTSQTQPSALADRVNLLTGPQVLMLEDDASVVKLLKPRLEKAGYQVTVIDQVDAALEFACYAAEKLNLIILDVLLEGTDSFALLEQLKEDESTAHIPVLISSFSVAADGESLTVEVVDYIATSFEETQVLERVRLALSQIGSQPADHKPTPSPPKRKMTGRILVADDDQKIVQWLKDALEASGYEIHRAFNSQQALDIAVVSKPHLVLINPKMFNVEGEPLISRLRRVSGVETTPIIVITNRSVPPSTNSTMNMLGQANPAKMRQSFSIDVLVAEIMQADNKVGAKVIHE